MPDPRRYFDDIQVGEEYESPGRTVTEADIVLFAGLSGDYNVLHTDAEFMKQSIFGERIAHGLLGLAIQAGLVPRATQAYATLAVPFVARVERAARIARPRRPGGVGRADV